jgi:hypothetical protein
VLSTRSLMGVAMLLALSALGWTAPRAVLPAGAAAPMNLAQLQYGGGGDWYANPSGLPNLAKEIRLRTGLPVADRVAHIKLTDADLWTYPYLHVTGHGNIKFTEEEVQILRKYLQTGGFMHADDNYGLDESFRREMKRVFPDASLVELPKDHPIYHGFYDFPQGLPKIHKHDGKPAQGFGIFREGRLVVYYTYETDLGNGWEDQDRYGDPGELRESAIRMGVNIFLYALSQVTR